MTHSLPVAPTRQLPDRNALTAAGTSALWALFLGLPGLLMTSFGWNNEAVTWGGRTLVFAAVAAGSWSFVCGIQAVRASRRRGSWSCCRSGHQLRRAAVVFLALWWVVQGFPTYGNAVLPQWPTVVTTVGDEGPRWLPGTQWLDSVQRWWANR